MDRIIRPVVRGLEAEGCPFQGVIFAGLMIDPVSIQPPMGDWIGSCFIFVLMMAIARDDTFEYLLSH